MSDIFISYSSHDRLQAVALAETLRRLGYDPWIDQHQIHGSARWGKEIVKAINASSLVAVLVSSSSLGSENVIKELSLAASKHKHLLPVMLEACELTEEFAYHLTGLNRVKIDNTDSIVKALEQLKVRTQSKSGTDFSPSERTEIRSTTSSKDIRLAILPFDDLSKDHDNEWFADGMLDELITTLGALEHMKVPSRTDVMYYKKHHPKAQEIAGDLNVRYLVGGSVRKAGEKIRITASLTDSFTNQQLWTSNYDGNFDDIFELQERVSKQITEILKLKLSPEDKKKIEEQPTVSAEAYELWLRGTEFQRRSTREGYENAIRLYERAVKIDSMFLAAYLETANVSVAYYRECNKAPKWLNKAEENLKRVEEITGETAKSLWIKGEIAWQRNNFAEAELILLKATELDPNFFQIYNILGLLYLKTNDVAKAVAAFETVLRLKENYENYYNLLVSLSILGDTSRIEKVALGAVPVMKKYVEKNPNDLFWRVSNGYILHWARKDKEALEEADLLSNYQDLDGFTLYNLGSLYDDLGFPERNIELLQRSVQKGYREIELLKGQKYENVEHQRKLEQIIMELEKIIEKERSGS